MAVGQPGQIKKPTLYTTTFFRFDLCCYCPLAVVSCAIKYKTWQIEMEPQAERQQHGKQRNNDREED